MPEHIHLLISEPQEKESSHSDAGAQTEFCAARPGAGQTTAQSVPGQSVRETPLHASQSVQRGLVASPELWRWSSFRFYSLDEAGQCEPVGSAPDEDSILGGVAAKLQTASVPVGHFSKSARSGAPREVVILHSQTWPTRQPSF